jgi:hypothetical protein
VKVVPDLPCTRCDSGMRRPGDRFCKVCRKAVLAELKAAGYLQGLPWRMIARNASNERGYDREPNPSGENAVRALEDG